MGTKKRGKKSTVTNKGLISLVPLQDYLVLLWRVTILVLLFTLSRLVFYLFNLPLFSAIPYGEVLTLFVVGIRFDLSAILFLNGPFILLGMLPFSLFHRKGFRVVLNGYYYLINSLGLLVNFIDVIYIRFTLKRMNADIFDFLKVGGDFEKLIPQFMHDFWYILVLWLLFVGLLIWLSRLSFTRKPVRRDSAASRFSGRMAGEIFLFLVAGFLVVVGIRGGIQKRPIGMVTAGRYTTSQGVSLVLNTPFCIIRSIGHRQLEKVAYFSDQQEADSWFSPVHKAGKQGFHDYNVLVIILESFSLEHIGYANRQSDHDIYRGFTPVFDSLIPHGFFITGFANDKTSITGVPAILSSLPSLMDDAFIQSAYAANQLTSIAGLLKGKGYSTAFFHGGSNGTMGLDNYTTLVGFDRYFGRSEYGNEDHYDGKWGIRDEEFFQYTASRLNEMKEPFFASLFSLSSHHPYYVPKKYEHFFPEGNLPIQKSIGYTDYSLGQFLKRIRTMPWYDRTIIIITADHTSEGYLPYYRSGVGQYAIPFLFLFPGESYTGEIRNQVVQQTDILPTVMNYLGYDRDYIAFGTDMLDSNAIRFAVHWNSGIYTLIKDGYIIDFDGTNTLALYRNHPDSIRNPDLKAERPEVVKQLERFLKAYIQQYNNRMIENRLTVR